MKRGLAGFVAALALAPAAAAAPSCRIPGGTTVAGGSVAKLIRVPTPSGSALFACIRRSGRKEYLDDDARVPRLAGRWVAWQRTVVPERPRIVVHDLRTGKERLVVGRVASPALVLTTRGTVVWVQESLTDERTPLFVNDTVTGGRLLDAADVTPASLRLAGRRVFWESGGAAHTTVVR